MEKVKIISNCEYSPPGSNKRIKVRPGHIVAVDRKEAEKLEKGGVAERLNKPKPAIPKKVEA